MGDTLPTAVIDNSATAISLLFRPVYFFSTGAVGINKTAEYGYAVEHIGLGALGTADIYGMLADGTRFGQWKRVVSFDSLVRPEGVGGTLSATSYIGIGLGTYLAAPPDPATTTTNVVRLVVQMDTMAWKLIVHPGDGVSAQTKTALTGVPAPVLQRTQHARIVWNPGQWIRAYIDGVLGLELTTGLPIQTIGGSFNTWLVASGSGSANVRGAFTAPHFYYLGCK